MSRNGYNNVMISESRTQDFLNLLSYATTFE